MRLVRKTSLAVEGKPAFFVYICTGCVYDRICIALNDIDNGEVCTFFIFLLLEKTGSPLAGKFWRCNNTKSNIIP